MIVVPGDAWCSVSEALPLFIVLLHCPSVAIPVPAPVVPYPFPIPVPVRVPVPTPFSRQISLHTLLANLKIRVPKSHSQLRPHPLRHSPEENA